MVPADLTRVQPRCASRVTYGSKLGFGDRCPALQFHRLGVGRGKVAAESRDHGIAECTGPGSCHAHLPMIGNRVVSNQRPVRSEADRERACPKELIHCFECHSYRPRVDSAGMPRSLLQPPRKC